VTDQIPDPKPPPDGAQPADAIPAATPATPVDPRADPTPPRRPRSTGPVQYRGTDLEPERGPGLGCFRIQVVVLVIFIILTPLTVAWNWPIVVSTVLLFAVILLLLVTGQTIIFLLRLVAADRRGRRRPLASGSKTVGELEDASAPTNAPAEGPATDVVASGDAPADDAASSTEDRAAPASASPNDPADDPFPPDGPVRQ
jgi:hypothetical protein